MDTIAMIKKNKTKYLHEEQSLNIKQIYHKNRKRHGRSKYLISLDINLEKMLIPFQPESCVSAIRVTGKTGWL